ncbi:MAG: DUF6049 family protein [Nocardioides sp.]|nr:DUF6049 family protein [Nocardioides sp.]
MPRPPVFRAALAGLLTLVLAWLAAMGPLSVAAVGVTSSPEAVEDPLVVHIDSISTVLPRRGNVEITGTVTNVSADTFTRINLHVFSSQSPLTDAATLSASAAIDPTKFVGPRVTEPGTFATIDVLEPGDTADFADSVPVELLGIPDIPGVYWIGIHALGDGASPRDDVADGRARTFIPLLPAGSASGDVSQETAIILPLRSRVWFDQDGRIGGTERWAHWLEEGGRLDATLDISDTAGATPYSWLVDPAILVALVRLSKGNPPRTIAPDPTVEGQQPSPTQSPTANESTATPTLTASTPPEEELSEEEQALAAAASDWLNRFLTGASGRTILTLPFGDLDVSAAVRHSPDRLDEAVNRSAQVMSELGLASEPTLAPENDVLSAEALAAASDDTTVLLGDNAFASPPASPTSVVRVLGHTVVVTSTGAESGGPGPTPADDPLALRQRLLSEAAIRLAAEDPAPVVLTVPSGWEPADAASFFGGLGEPWLNVIGVPEVADRLATDLPDSSLAYTETDETDELDIAHFDAATDVSDTATVLEGVLSAETTIEAQVRDELLVTLSQQHRSRPRPAVAAANRVTAALRADLGKIQIDGPTAVTLSSDSGPIGVTLVNLLDEAVTVRIEATTDGDLAVSGTGVRELGPGSRSPVRFEVQSTRPGVHNVRLAVTTVDGTPIGSFDEVPIRAAGVSALIWIIMAGAALVLFGAIGYRLPRQIRARRLENASAGASAQPDDVRPLPQAAP